MPSRGRRTAHAAVRPGLLFVDSGAWIALRSRRDQHHVEAGRLFEAAVTQGMTLLTTSLVIAETHRFTLFRAGPEPALRGLQRIDASPRVRVHFPAADEHAAARRWLERLMPHPITYTDAVSFAVMQAAGCREVLGFDQDFVAAGFTFWHGGVS